MLFWVLWADRFHPCTSHFSSKFKLLLIGVYETLYKINTLLVPDCLSSLVKLLLKNFLLTLQGLCTGTTVDGTSSLTRPSPRRTSSRRTCTSSSTQASLPSSRKISINQFIAKCYSSLLVGTDIFATIGTLKFSRSISALIFVLLDRDPDPGGQNDQQTNKKIQECSGRSLEASSVA
jgi:hypothetical protein